MSHYIYFLFTAADNRDLHFSPVEKDVPIVRATSDKKERSSVESQTGMSW